MYVGFLSKSGLTVRRWERPLVGPHSGRCLLLALYGTHECMPLIDVRSMLIRPAMRDDWAALWSIIEP